MSRPALFYLLAAVAATQNYQATWESVERRPTPSWFQDAKFGYSVPAYAPVGNMQSGIGTTFARDLLTKGQPNATYEFHQRNYGASFEYPDFAPQFRAEMFDPAHWAEVFERSGAKYVVLTSKHHDGFALWPSEHANRTWGRPWNSASAGPKRDLVGDLTSAVRERVLRMGLYFSLYEWYNPLWLADRRRYVSEHMIPQFKDVVTRYKPALIFSDGEWDMPSEAWKSPELLAWLFNESPVREEVVVNDRWGKETRHKHGGYFTTEYTAGLETGSHPWEESRGMAHSYGYNRAERFNDYRSERELILMLIDLVSRGGNLLLDIGPTADGRIPVIMEERLTQIGRWLAVHGEAIYGTRPWVRMRQWSKGERLEMKSGTYMVRYEVTDHVDAKKPGQAVIESFFTAKGSDVYAIVPGWPGRELTIKDAAAGAGFAAALLGGPTLRWRAAGSDLVITMPELAPDAGKAYYAYVVKLSSLQPL